MLDQTQPHRIVKRMFLIAALLITPIAVQVQAGAPATAPATTPTTAPAAAVDPALQQTAHTQAQACADALLSGDFKTLIHFTHPKVIEMVGSADQLIALIQKGQRDMKAANMAMTGATVSPPEQLITTDTDTFAILPQRITMTLANGQVTQDSFLLGHSVDGGATWTFIDGTGLNDRTMKRLFPDAPADLKLPAKQKPVFVADN